MAMPDNFQQLLEVTFPQLQFSAVTMLILALVSLLLVGLIFYFVVKSYVIPLLHSSLNYLKPDLTEAIATPLRGVSARLSLMGPLVFYLATFSWFLPDKAPLLLIINKVFYVYLYINVALLLNSLLNIGCIIYNQQAYAKEVPIKGIIQIFKLTVFIVFAGLAIAELIDKSPLYLLSSLGAITAVLLLVFKDTIMGLVAGVQIATHRLVAHGDWIEMPNYGADGDVLEVGLHTVKVQNFDKTITTIPTYKLISESFKNWRGMSESAGRRIKRALLIDVNSIHFINTQKCEQLLESIASPEFSALIQQQGGEQTNMGLYRRYCEFYLIGHSKINHQMTCMARQLAPNEYGVPLEIYCFSADKDWVTYEKIQAEIVEHLLARLTGFELRAFQRPSDRH